MDISDIPEIDEVYVIDPEMPWMGPKLREREMVVQSGTGMNNFNTAVNIIKELPTMIKTADTLAFGPVGTYVSNTASEMYNKNPEWKPGFAGEKHMVLPTNHGLTRANYAGPGTKLDIRQSRGDKGVDGPRGIDEAARKHDIAYSLATTPDQIRRADEVFIDDVDNSIQKPIVKRAVKAAMKAKRFAEDVGIIDEAKWLGKGKKKEDSFAKIKGKDSRKKGTKSIVKKFLKNREKRMKKS